MGRRTNLVRSDNKWLWMMLGYVFGKTITWVIVSLVILAVWLARRV